MALQSGTRLGQYEVTAQIGMGGMGEVLLSFAVVFCHDDEKHGEVQFPEHRRIALGRGQAST